MAVTLKPTEHDLVWKKETVWSCKAHAAPEFHDEYESEFDWDWPTVGCSCRRGARWVPTGRRKLTVEMPFDRILKSVYLPALQEAFNAVAL